MANTGHSSRDPFSGYITHRDSSGKKTGTSKPNWGGGYTNYDAKGHKVGEIKRNWAGGLDHYDAKGHKIGESKRNFADGLDHYDAKGKKTGTSYRNFANGYDNYDEDGCYIATCVYGSYDCPEVWTLRRFRDHTLGSSMPGRAFIHIYYATAPALVRWFGECQWFRTLWRGRLNDLVARLQEKGVEATPYQDENWRKRREDPK